MMYQNRNFSWRRILRSKIRNSAAAEKETAKARNEAPSEANSAENKLWWS